MNSTNVAEWQWLQRIESRFSQSKISSEELTMLKRLKKMWTRSGALGLFNALSNWPCNVKKNSFRSLFWATITHLNQHKPLWTIWNMWGYLVLTSRLNPYLIFWRQDTYSSSYGRLIAGRDKMTSNIYHTNIFAISMSVDLWEVTLQ